MKPKFFLLIILTLTIIHQTLSIATVRYVSKTGTSTPPYTSWQTAADSIQKCINICVDGDTVYVANGVYYEAIYVDKTINLWGSSMDNTVINGSATDSLNVVKFVNNNSFIQSFKIIGLGKNCISLLPADIKVKFCNLSGYIGIAVSVSSVEVDNCIVSATENTIFDAGWSNSHQKYINSIFLSKNNFGQSIFIDGGSPTILNNVIIEEPPQNSNSTRIGIDIFYFNGLDMRNNLVSGFREWGIGIGDFTGDTAFVINNNSMNIFATGLSGAIGGGRNGIILRNNLIQNSKYGIRSNDPVVFDYGLFWNVQYPFSGSATLGDSNIVADPMFVNDTIPRSNISYDLHLQKYSPAIDKGDPSILDVDGSRSDIGMFGGPGGEYYKYLDLAPRTPRNFIFSFDSTSKILLLNWDMATESDFRDYKIFRDTLSGFIPNQFNLIAQSDTSLFSDNLSSISSGSVYYKITAMDNQDNESQPGNEIAVTITGIEPIVEILRDYILYQNYPNPFNPNTKISYEIKNRSYVKLMVYDLKGELVSLLVNKEQNAGYYEIEFSSSGIQDRESSVKGLASGIYLYRIEVIGDGNIPVYTDMKKMILIK